MLLYVVLFCYFKAEVLSDVGAEISFQLPSNASASFKALLMDIDAHTDDLCVSSYGMSVTTLEEVSLQ
jgi:ATP-binding cassette, subfamily A (ABC1), member 3